LPICGCESVSGSRIARIDSSSMPTTTDVVGDGPKRFCAKVAKLGVEQRAAQRDPPNRRRRGPRREAG
jgi:hypothetical protein